MLTFLNDWVPDVKPITVSSFRSSTTLAHFILQSGKRTKRYYVSLYFEETKNRIRLVHSHELLFLPEKEKKGYTKFIEKLIHVLVTYLESHPKFRLKMATGSFSVEYLQNLF